MVLSASGSVGTRSLNTFLTSGLSTLHKQIANAALQQSSGLKSLNYAGYGASTSRIISLETQFSRIEGYLDTNTSTVYNLEMMDKTLNSLTDELNNAFKALKELYQRGYDPQNMRDEDYETIKFAQEQAFLALSALAGYLNDAQSGTGQYLFSGSRTDTAPINFPYSNLDEFQKMWDGVDLSYSWSRSAAMNDYRATGAMEFFTQAEAVVEGLTVGNNQGAIKEIDSGEFLTGLTIGSSGAEVTGGVLTGVNVGQVSPGDVLRITDSITGDSYIVTVETVDNTGAAVLKAEPPVPEGFVPDSVQQVNVPNGLLDVNDAGINNGTYKIVGIQEDASGNAYLIVEPPPSSMNGANAAKNATIERQTYYNGDSLNTTYNMDANRSIEVGINGGDAAFEKAYRALALIAQGDLVNNPDRVDEAYELLSDALNHKAANTWEDSSDITKVHALVSMNYATVKTVMSHQQDTKTFIEANLSDIKGVDDEVVAAQLLTLQTQLTLSYAAFSVIQGLNLSDYF